MESAVLFVTSMGLFPVAIQLIGNVLVRIEQRIERNGNAREHV